MKKNSKVIISSVITVVMATAMVFATLAAGNNGLFEEPSSVEELSSGAEIATDIEEVSSEAAEEPDVPAEDASETASEAESASEEESSEAPVDYIPGDVNGDGQIFANDARLALRASARLEVLDARALLAADYNGDGELIAADARAILRVSAKLPPYTAEELSSAVNG